MGRVIAKAKVRDLDSIPKSVRWSEGEVFDEDAWSSSVEILLQQMMGWAPADEDPIPPDNVEPHPVPGNNHAFPGFHINPQHVQQDDMDVDEGHWALQPPVVNNVEVQDEFDFLQGVQQEEIGWDDGEELPP